MKYKNILVPFDGSDHARDALKAAEDLVAGVEGAHITILNVIASSDINPTFGTDNPFWSSADLMGYDEYKDYMKRVIDSAKSGLEDSVHDDLERLGDKASVDVIAYPGAARGIAEYVGDHDIDLIVMGRRGLGALRGMLGSVSYGVLGSVDVPVLTIK
jgi:nucleotide-binding universal stress UspA family protein